MREGVRDGLSLSPSLDERKTSSFFTFHSVASIASFSSFRDSGVAPAAVPAAAASEVGGRAEDMR